MLETIIVILVVLWLLGVLTSFGGNLIWLLLLIAGAILILRLMQGRNIG